MPVVPGGKLVVSRLRAGGVAIAMLRAALLVWAAASVTWAVKLNVPLLVGVPLMVPLDTFKVNPPGSAPVLMLHV